MSKDPQPTVPSLIQFQQDLNLNGKGIRTQQSYLRSLRKFQEFLSKDPASASEDDPPTLPAPHRRYQTMASLHLQPYPSPLRNRCFVMSVSKRTKTDRSAWKDCAEAEKHGKIGHKQVARRPPSPDHPTQHLSLFMLSNCFRVCKDRHSIPVFVLFRSSTMSGIALQSCRSLRNSKVNRVCR